MSVSLAPSPADLWKLQTSPLSIGGFLDLLTQLNPPLAQHVCTQLLAQFTITLPAGTDLTPSDATAPDLRPAAEHLARATGAARAADYAYCLRLLYACWFALHGVSMDNPVSNLKIFRQDQTGAAARQINIYRECHDRYVDLLFTTLNLALAAQGHPPLPPR